MTYQEQLDALDRRLAALYEARNIVHNLYSLWDRYGNKLCGSSAYLNDQIMETLARISEIQRGKINCCDLSPAVPALAGGENKVLTKCL